MMAYREGSLCSSDTLGGDDFLAFVSATCAVEGNDTLAGF